FPRRQASAMVVAGRFGPELRQRSVARESRQRLGVGCSRALDGRGCPALLKRAEDAAMNIPPVAQQQSLVGLIADERMLEKVSRGRRLAPADEQPRPQQMIQALVQQAIRPG